MRCGPETHESGVFCTYRAIKNNPPLNKDFWSPGFLDVNRLALEEESMLYVEKVKFFPESKML